MLKDLLLLVSSLLKEGQPRGWTGQRCPSWTMGNGSAVLLHATSLESLDGGALDQ